MSYTITQSYITGPNRPGEHLTPAGIVVHSTATPGATAEDERTYFQAAPRGASVHAFVDWNSLAQIIPWNEVAWGSGPTSNHKFLQIELCEPKVHDPGQFNEVWNRAVWLFAYLFVNIIKVNTITKESLMSHAEVSDKWRETSHQDPVSYFSGYGKNVDQFRTAVQEAINSMIKPKEVFDMKKIVVYVGDADLFAAILVSQKLACPLMRKADYDVSGLKAQQVITIGGKPGSTRFSTFKDAAALV